MWPGVDGAPNRRVSGGRSWGGVVLDQAIAAEDIAQNATDAHAATVEDLLNPVADPAALGDEGAPVAGQGAHLAERLGRHMAGGGQEG